MTFSSPDAKLTWLHLSDWHQQKKGLFDRSVVRDALLKDIRGRAEISPKLAQLDFIVFSGDVAHRGKAEEYEAAKEELFDKALEVSGLGPEQLFIVPGNHDLDRDKIELVPSFAQKPFEAKDEEKVKEWLDDDTKRSRLFADVFEAYTQFVSGYTGQASPHYASIRRFVVRGVQIALLGINSAWMSGRKKEKGKVNDYGYLTIGEPQIHAALDKIADADLRIAVLHHPFDWLAEFDRNRVEERLGRECHFILRGHQHTPQIKVMGGTFGDCVIIPAGASYKRRDAENPLYTNAYNFVHVNLKAGKGMVYFRRWGSRWGEWIEDIESVPGGQYEFTLPKELGHPAAPPPVEIQTEDTSDLSPGTVSSATLDIRKDNTMNDQSELQAQLQGVESAIAQLEAEREKGMIDSGRYMRLKEEYETRKAKLTQKLTGPMHAHSALAPASVEQAVLQAVYQVHRNTPGKSANSERIRKQLGLDPTQMHDTILALQEQGVITSRFVGGTALLNITADGVTILEA